MILRWLYYNADGQPSSMCGNGGRCIVAFAKFLGVINSETEFLAVDGPHYAKISAEGDWVSLQMIDVTEINTDAEAYVLNTGSPHYVQLVNGLKEKDVYHDGYNIRNNDTYRAQGINVNFVEPTDAGYFVRTFERGVEDETYACGTGVTAVALAMAKHNNLTGHIDTPVKVLGGNLNIRFNYDGERYTDIFLEGPAVKVFEGDVEIVWCADETWINANDNYAFVDFDEFNRLHPDAGEYFWMKALGHLSYEGKWNQMFNGIFFIRDIYPCTTNPNLLKHP